MKPTKNGSRKRLSKLLVGLVMTGVMTFTSGVTAFAAVNNADVNNASESRKGIFYTDYATPDELMREAKKLAEEVSEEGMVLMKNDSALPLAKHSRISVFGKSSVNPAYGGGGSGALIGVEPVSLYDGLRNAGFYTNGVLESFYNNPILSGTGRSDKTYVNETPVSAYNDSVTGSFNTYKDAAVVVITRTGAEGSDLPRTGNDKDGGARYLSITKNEKDLIDYVNSKFDKVVLLVNSSNTIELSSVKDKVDAILWIGNPGERGFNAVGRILNGEVNPSGKLSDAYVSDLTLDPTWANFGNNNQNQGVGYVTKKGSEYQYKINYYNALRKTGEKVPVGTTVTVNGEQKDIGGMDVYESAGTYTEYEEGVYVGYRYYETRAYEMSERGEAWYDTIVDYAFGEGLSYTTFKKEWADGVAPTLDMAKNGELTFKVKVTNTGSVAGKDVIQLYYSAPYTAGGIEKSYVNLGAYAKTDMLQPGESGTYTLKLKVQDMASFDWNDANENGFKGYELEGGTYKFFIGNGSHCWTAPELQATADLSVTDGTVTTDPKKGVNGYTYTTDARTGNDIKVLFSNNDIYNTNLMQTENKLKRSDFAAAATDKNIIAEKTLEQFTLSDEGWAQIKKTSNLFSIDKDESDYYAFEGETHAPWYVETAPSTWKQYAGDEASRPAPTYTFADMAGWSYDDEKWETVLNELSFKELKDIVYVAGFTNAKVDYIGKDMAIDDDGPMQVKLNQSPLEGTNDDFVGSGWPCAVLVASTWNVELAERQGVMIGNECLYLGISGWFAPAMNLHRNQYGGRIFEYYSSDPVHGGYIAAAVTRGVQSKGVYAFLKHFCLNNQDTGRGSISIVVNEQAMRELYMRTFELAVEEGGAHGLMTYYSYVGGVSIMTNYAILTEFVRNQWGFEGVINHDYGPESYTSSICNPALTRRVGNGLGGNGATYNRYSDMDYYDAKTNMVYYCLDAAGKVTTNAVASPTHWAALRTSAKQLLWTTANSNNQRNKLDFDVFKGGELTIKQDKVSAATVGIDTSKFGTDNVTYEIFSGELPEGITLNRYTGALEGKTTKSGTYTFEVRMRADYYMKKTEAFTLNVEATAKITSSTPTETGKEYYGVIEAESFATAKDMSYMIVGGKLPEGYELNSSTGEITGVATTPGKYVVKINIHGVIETKNNRGQTVLTNKDLSIDVTFEVTGKTLTEVKIDELEETVKRNEEDSSKNAETIKQLEDELNKANEKIKALEEKASTNNNGSNGGANGCNGAIGGDIAVIMLIAALMLAGVAVMRKKDKEKS